jgi:hypothetical protein
MERIRQLDSLKVYPALYATSLPTVGPCSNEETCFPNGLDAQSPLGFGFVGCDASDD